MVTNLQRYATLFVAAAVLCGLPGCGDGNGGKADSPSPQANAAERADGVISWKQASQHLGERVTVEGPVKGTHYAESTDGQPTFINVGRDYPSKERFTVVVWQGDRGAFDTPPESKYRGKTIRVTGTVDQYEGMPQIEVDGPADIEIVE